MASFNMKENDIEAFMRQTWVMTCSDGSEGHPRKYGTFPHSGFGMGLERFVAWVCGIHHLREAIPYPRTMKRIYP